jgi:Peptidase propeptide and YPEB domain
MRSLLASTGLAMVLGAGLAFADRPLTDEEKAKVTAAVTAEGCSGGKMEFDDGRFEVDDAKCSDDKIYDLKFDAAYKLIRKDPEH